jgi:uncharacterized protein YjeT (DUF2065 family)
MRSGVKRAAAIVGLTAVLLGLAYLTYPVSSGDLDCGSALMTGSQHGPQKFPEQCKAPIRRQRRVGGVILALGTVILLGAGPRYLMPD